MARVRVHQHVNPLARYFRELEIEPLDLPSIFENAKSKLQIDIGSGRGRFLLKMARKFPDLNFLGLEIREPLVTEANEICERENLKNLHYSFCSAPLHLGRLLRNVPAETVSLITIQFPDPWFKKRHMKRRMVNPQLVGYITDHLATDGRVFVQTDVGELADDMGEHFKNGGFRKETLYESFLPIKTERELSVERRKLPVYRAVYYR